MTFPPNRFRDNEPRWPIPGERTVHGNQNRHRHQDQESQHHRPYRRPYGQVDQQRGIDRQYAFNSASEATPNHLPPMFTTTQSTLLPPWMTTTQRTVMPPTPAPTIFPTNNQYGAPSSCELLDTEWSACSAECGTGVSIRMSNHNAACRMQMDVRICMTRPCDAIFTPVSVNTSSAN